MTDRLITHGPPIFPRSVEGRIPDEQADEALKALRRLWADVQARQADKKSAPSA